MKQNIKVLLDKAKAGEGVDLFGSVVTITHVGMFNHQLPGKVSFTFDFSDGNRLTFTVFDWV